MTACGGSPPSNAPMVSKLKERVFLSNFQTNLIQIIDAQTDTLSTFTISVTAPTRLLVSTDKSTTMAYAQLAKQVTAITNSTETAVGSGINLPDTTDSLAISPNGQTGYAAFPTQVCSGSAVVGGVGVLDLVNSAIKACIAVAGARNISLSHNGNTLLVFGDNSNTVEKINTGSLSAAPVPINSATFDHPVSAVFSADDSTAYILSCGPECGGAMAGAAVTAVTAVGSSTPTAGNSIAFPTGAARIGLLNNSTLYIAGTNPANGGVLQVVDANLTAIQQSKAIGDGVQDAMTIQGSTVFIGARACANQAHGCVSMFDTGSKQVFFNVPSSATGQTSDDVTGMEAIPSRTVVYVCEGGKLRIYDAGTHALAPTQIGIVGNASDVREVF
jgi:hypothetical protein